VIRMAEQNAPALPWAAQQAANADVKPVQDTHAPTAIPVEDLQPVSIQQLGLEPGARIEVSCKEQSFNRLSEALSCL
jgi:hypothetical protein